MVGVHGRVHGRMVGEAHLVGVADIFNVKYIRYPVHECGLILFVDRRLQVYIPIYTGSQYFLGQAQMNPFPLQKSYTYYSHTAFQLLYAISHARR